MSLDILKEDLKKKSFRNLYLFYGQEEYLKKFYLESIESCLISEDFKALNKVTLEGRVDVGKIIDNCETLPVFSEKRLVVVKNSGFFKPKKKQGEDSGPVSGSNELLKCIQDIPPHACVIFYEAEVDKRMKSLLDAVKKNGLVVEFNYLKPDELVRWVTKKFKAWGKDIDLSSASMIIENCEQGMTEISNELDKLNAYTAGRNSIIMADIEAVCSKSIKSRIFDLTDAISEKNGTRALKLVNDMSILKEPMPKVLFMITRQFRQILQIKLLSSEGMSTNEAAGRIGVTPYGAGKLLKQSGSFTVETLKKALEKSLEMDIAVKTGKLDDRMAVELLIMEFSKI
jgi:DNA polymerase-3 subunit delta